MAYHPEFSNIPPEVFLSPEFWDGHSLDDDCPWRNPHAEKPMPFLAALREIRDESKAEAMAGIILRDYLALPDQTPVRTFTDGATFDASLYPEGTIVRVREEMVWADKTPHYVGYLSWGVVLRMPGKDEPYLFTQSQSFIAKNGKPSRGHWRKREHALETRKVTHERLTAVPRLPALELIKRVNMVQLMKQGVGVPRKAQEERRIWIGRRLLGEA